MPDAEIIQLLKEIKANQAPPKFNTGTAFCVALATAFTFVMALALNAALALSFQQINIHGSALASAWVYAVIAVVIVLIMLYLIYRWLEPALSKQFSKLDDKMEQPTKQSKKSKERKQNESPSPPR
jgi:p-aminobenzoyl-glutamate transporter AbgT